MYAAVRSWTDAPESRPSWIAPRGVGPETASRPNRPWGCFQVVMYVGKETRRKTRPTRAGFQIFWPIPPKVILATPIATTAPMNTTHQGVV